MTLQLVKVAVGELREAHISPEIVACAIESCLQDGLKGNRAVADNLWSVATAAVRAFPIQLSPSVEKAQAAVLACPELDLVKTWLVQATADGSLVIMLQKLRSQPQILTAYDSKAPIRNAATVQQLIDLLQELQTLIPMTPHDIYLQHQALQQPAAANQPVHIQTEQDLPHHSHHPSSSSDIARPQQEQQFSGQCQSDSLQSLSKASPTASSSSSSLSAQEPAGSRAEASNGSRMAAAAPKRIDKQLLLGAFSRKASSSRSGPAGNITAATCKDAVEAEVQSPACKLPASGCPQQLYVKVQLEVVSGTRDQQNPVVLHLEVGTSTCSSSSSSPSAPSSKGASSSSRFLGAGAGAMKGLLQGLQQSATSSLQQSAAAGQDISGAVVAAGGAVAAAMGQPFAAVKGFAAAAAGRAGGKKASSSRRTSPTKVHACAEIGVAGAVDAAERSTSSRQLPRFFKPKPSGAAAAADSSSRSTSAASPAPADDGRPPLSPSEPVVQLQLSVSGDAAAEAPVRCVIKAVISSGTTSSTAGAGVWGAKGLMNKFSSMGRSSKDANRHGKQQRQQQQGAGDGAAGVSEGSGDGDVLEGDMWSVMSRLRNNSMTQTAAAPGTEDESCSAAGGEAAATQQLHEQGQQLRQQLLDTCSQVAAAAAATKGCLGDECPELLQLVELLKCLFNHGLKQSSSSSESSSADAGGKAAAVFSGWLSSRSLTAFGVLQALQHGSKQHPRLMLGADSISSMQAARHASPAVMLELWVRSSINEQLLGVRFSTLLANPAAVAQYYQPQALLLQQQQMQELQQHFAHLVRCRFALLVEAPAAVGAATTAAGSSSSSSATKGSVMDPRRLLGGFSKSFNTLRAGSSSNTSAAAAPAAATSNTSTALADPAAAASSNSSSAIPTFLWSALGHSSSSSTATASDAAPEAGAVSSGPSMLKRGQRRLANILEVKVPPPDSAAVLSSENSCALSPVSTPGDAAYAEWWSPNSSFQDMQTAAAAAAARGQERSTSVEGLLPDPMQKDDPDTYYAPEGSSTSSFESLGGFAPQAAAAASSSDKGKAAHLHGSVAGSEAAKKLEQELTAAMAAPLQVLLDHSRRTDSSSGSSGGGAAGSACDLGSGSKSAELHRSSSSGWEAAVASARARSKGRGGASGVPGRQHISSGNLSGQGRPLGAHWPAAGAGLSGASSGGTGSEGANMHSQAGAVGSSSSRVRHMHKRSSSLNDLPELAAFLESGVVQL